MDISFVYHLIDAAFRDYQEQQQCTADEAGRVFLSEVGQLLIWLSTQPFDGRPQDLLAAYAQHHQDHPMIVILDALIRQVEPLLISSTMAADAVGH